MTTAQHRRRPGGRQRREVGGPDAGLTLIELMVALMVAFVALTVLAGIFVSSVHTLTVAKQRQSATALGVRAMEQMRALPFSSITSGLSSSDLAGDTANIDLTGPQPLLKPAAAPTVNEVLQTNGAAHTPTATLPLCRDLTNPLLPHRCTATLDGVVYTVASYVSQANLPAGAPTQYSLTTIVTWKSNATRGKDKTIVNRSRAFSPNGTCSPANHPFNTPCQSQYHAHAGLSEGGVTLSGLVDGAPIAPGSDVLSAELSLPRLTTSTAVEQTVTVSGSTGAHSAEIVRTTGPPLTAGEPALSSAATDPSNSVVVAPVAQASKADPLQHVSAGWTVTVTPEQSGTWFSTSRAASAPGSSCKDLVGVDLTNSGQPCGDSSAWQTAEAKMTIQSTALSGRHLQVDLARFGAPTAASRALSARFVTNTPTWCPGATGFGCVAAAAERSLGATVLGQLPTPAAGDAPLAAGFTGAVLLDGYVGKVTTASATGAAPSLASRDGQLRVWNGTSYTLHDLSTAAASLPVVAAVGTYQGVGGQAPVTVTVTGAVEVSAASASPAGCSATLCEASTGSIVADLTYDYSIGGVSQAAFRVRTDLGALLAKTSYVAA